MEEFLNEVKSFFGNFLHDGGLTIIRTIAFALLGLVFNLRFPNMDWVNPNDVLKRSAPVVLTMVVDFALVIAAGVLYYFLGLPFAYFAGALAILLALASLGLWAWCQKGGARRFMEL